MSNNLVSQPLSLPNRQMGQMEPVSDKVMGMVGPMSNNPASHQFAVSNQHMGLVEPMSYNPGSQDLQMGSMEAKVGHMGSQQVLLPSKRKAPVEPLFTNSVQQQSSIPNKRVAHREPLSNSPGSPQVSAPNKRTVQMQTMSSTPGSQNLPATNKRMVRNDSISSKSGSQRIQTPKNRTAQMEPSPKAQAESFEAVRSKMRESLAAALDLVHQDKSPNEEKSSRTQEGSQPAESTSAPDDTANLSENAMDTKLSKDAGFVDKPSESQSTSAEISTNESMGNSAQTRKHDGRESQCNAVLPDGDVSFSDNLFVKDELLQGNGLSWAWDIDMVMAETKEVQTAEKPRLVHVDVGGDGGEQTVRSEDLAFKIEEELFKLFGGVNKKYKEKGRSLMFNLKDRNNPELRERVMSGDLSPERLCSMTAEELASKELSEWRVAKAQELAQMIVLPDSDVDVRRLVKKTHKGEYQVEVEQDDDVSVEVSVGTTFTRIRPKGKETTDHPSSEVDEIKDRENVGGEKSSSENQDHPLGSITIPADGTDLMQGLIVEEDAEFLPPIVSLDEFMESLNSEPPFENLPVDPGQMKPLLDKETSDTGDKLVACDPSSKDPVDTNTDKVEKRDVKSTELEVNVKPTWSPVERKISPVVSASTAEHVWEGVLQLHISAHVTVTGLFRSGEKTSTKEWPSSLEIKGRVRLDAFEKFLQELPMSRSRAVMVAHFVLKEGSSQNDHASLSEVVDSYVLDERLGFAEPAPGVELYFCPTHPRILELLGKHLAKDRTEILNSTDNGLIGVVVWRKAHLTSTISPNSSSHHKHSSKKQHITSSRPQGKDTNVNVNLTTRAPMPFRQPLTNFTPPPDNDNDDDDIPPGFGPAAARDEDDLPEFNFSGNLNSSVSKFSSQNHAQGSRMTPFHPPQSSPRPVDQMRELINKYGQTGTGATVGSWPEKRVAGVGVQRWNDEDDDIPEWNPQAPQQQLQTHLPTRGFHQPIQPHMVNQHPGLAQPHALVQPPMQTHVNMAQHVAPSWPQGARWVQPPGPHGQQPSSLGGPPNVGQYYGLPVSQAGQPGTDRKQENPRNRGF